MLREALSNQYEEEKQESKSNDVKLSNRDMEINMGKEEEDNQQEDGEY